MTSNSPDYSNRSALFDLTGRVALITGGNGGIGLSLAEGLGNAGAMLVLVGRNQQKGDAAVARLEGKGIQVRFVPADVSSEQEAARAVAECVGTFGRLDILVNNAGVTARKRPEEISLEEWNYVLGSNLTAPLLCARAAYEAFKAQRGGKIINIGSMFSIFASNFSVAYGSSKGGVVQLTKTFAVAWAADNIQANAILPGWIETDMGHLVRSTPGYSERIVARTPAGRWGRVEDLQGIAVFLASKASDFITGTAIPVDGGYSSVG